MEITAPNRAQAPRWMQQIGISVAIVGVGAGLIAGLVFYATGEGTAASPWLEGLNQGSEVIVSPVGSDPRPEPTPRLVTADPISTVVVEADSGTIEVAGSDEDQVVVERTKRSHFNPPAVTNDLEGGRLTLGSDCGVEPRCWVDHRIIVPRDVAIEVRGGRGDVSIVGLTGSLAVDRSIGNVTVQDVQVGTPSAAVTASEPSVAHGSSVEVRVLAGTIDLSLRRPIDRLELSTKIGNVDISLWGGTYQIDAETVIGQVHIDVPTDSTSDSTINVNAPTGVIRVVAL